MKQETATVIKVSLAVLAGLIIVFAMTYVGPAEAQGQQWVRCKSIMNGDIQNFPGTQRPTSWYPI